MTLRYLLALFRTTAEQRQAMQDFAAKEAQMKDLHWMIENRHRAHSSEQAARFDEAIAALRERIGIAKSPTPAPSAA